MLGPVPGEDIQKLEATAVNDPVGLVVMVKNRENISLAGLRLHDETSILEALNHASQTIAQNPDAFRPETTLVVGEVRVREVLDD